jgi:hypothetical protein
MASDVNKLDVVMFSILSNTRTGVDTFIETSRQWVEKEGCKVHLIYIVDVKYGLPKVKKRNGNIRAELPMPENMPALLSDSDKQTAYFLHCYRILSSYFSTMQNIIWHVQVPFLARLASIFRKNLGGAIITHVHIIPWKGYYDSDEIKFNKIYASYVDGYIHNLGNDRFEEYAYSVSDLVICVTESGKKHIMDTYNISSDKIKVVPNGILDTYAFAQKMPLHKKQKDTILFVGRVVKSKGVWFMLATLSIIQQLGYDFKLILVGNISSDDREFILNEYGTLDIEIKGKISKKKLYELYKSSSFGIIPSLHEQCSYVAIEMLLHALPVVASKVDGLSEIFTDKTNALLFPLQFDKIKGLKPDAESFKGSIIQLLTNADLRLKLQKNARKEYLNKYTVQSILKELITCYRSFFHHTLYPEL